MVIGLNFANALDFSCDLFALNKEIEQDKDGFVGEINEGNIHSL